MSFKKLLLQAAWLAAAIQPCAVRATNPLVLDQFSADPTARVFDGKMYVYPSHDVVAVPGKGRPGWFCMEDYHVFSSENLTDWQDHGVIVSQTGVDWVKPASCSLWAPDCVSRNGKFYFYFPALAKDGVFRIGVATADKPEGPFTPEATPIEGVRGIDPCVLIDKDGSAYLFYAMRQILVAKLKDDMRELDGPPKAIANLPAKGLIEGPFVFERNGIYYLTYPHVENTIERIEYATGRSPLGPFEPAGVILDESVSGCWTVHHSIVEYRGQWYLFYHDKDLSPDFDKARSIRADRLFFHEDGAIAKVVPTLRGVGIVDARQQIQIDRYSAISREGAAVAFLNPAVPHEGWKVSLAGLGSWVRFDEVDFGKHALRSVKARAVSTMGSALEIRLDQESGPLLGRAEIRPGTTWEVAGAALETVPAGVHNLVVVQAGKNPVEVDWISFE